MSNRIGELRRERGLTLKKMGELLNIRDNTLSQYETGKREPQFGLLIEIANFFNVSLEYLMGRSNKRDYPVETDEDALYLLEKIYYAEIDKHNLSNSTSIQLAFWIAVKNSFLQDNYPELYDSAMVFVRDVDNTNKTLKWYSDMRKNENEVINEIIHLLELEDDYYGADPKTVLEFIKQSERIDYNDIEKVLNFMKSLPDAKDEG